MKIGWWFLSTDTMSAAVSYFHASIFVYERERCKNKIGGLTDFSLQNIMQT